MWMVNGELASEITVSDRGFMYGDGYFTTLQWRDDQPQFWDWHVERLLTTARRLRMPSLDTERLLARLCGLMAGQGDGGAKIMISRGHGVRGYSPQGCNAPTEIIQTFALPAHYPQWRQNGIQLGICQQRMAVGSLLAGLKSLNRLEQVLLRDELDARQLVEGIVCDHEGWLVEAVTANLFWRRDSVLYTPLLDRAGVDGVMRRWVLTQAAALGLQCCPVRVGPAALETADELFLTNALMEIVPVTGVEEVCYTNHEVARRLQDLLAASPCT